MMKTSRKFFLAIALFFIFFTPPSVNAISFGENINFYIDNNYDASDRLQITASLVKTSPKLYFYIEKSWWDTQIQEKKDIILKNLDNLSDEFNNKIYPILTSMFGQEWNPGVDGDSKITILFESMDNGVSGYFRTADEYIKLQLPESNEREMVYLAINELDNPNLKVFLAHEFMHLITFNQKNKKFDIEEDTWLNEARADYTSTILGYDIFYENSNLQKRVKDFIENPSDSIVEWRGTKYDYASASLFTHYLVDHYSVGILIDSLKSKYIGINSLNYALLNMGYKENFSKIFTNWTITAVLNDCSLGKQYCYLNVSLKNFRLGALLNFLPMQGNVSLSVTSLTKNWTGNWLKFIGGNGDLKLNFSSLKGLDFQVPYIIQDSGGSYEVKYLKLDEFEKGSISIVKFGTDYKSFIIIPSLQTKYEGFNGLEPTYPFTYSVSVKTNEPIEPVEDQALIQKLLDQIAFLKKQIADILAQRTCYISSNLYFGMSNNEEVKCLQSFLKSQGTNIYPEGYITGYFGQLTKQAVIRFQKKYNIPQTGFVGPITREKINER